MQHPDFLVWMLGFPAVITTMEILQYRFGERSDCTDKRAKSLAALVMMIIWLVVGKLLW